MQSVLTEEDIGKHFEIHERLSGYYGNGILSEVREENRDHLNRYWSYKFSSYANRHAPRDETPEVDNVAVAEDGMFLYLEIKKKKINPQLKRDLERRVHTKKNGRRVNELSSKLPLEIRQNVFEYLTEEKVPDPSKKRQNNGGRISKKKTVKKRRKTKRRKNTHRIN
jgi:hypothetical protein